MTHTKPKWTVVKDENYDMYLVVNGEVALGVVYSTIEVAQAAADERNAAAV